MRYLQILILLVICSSCNSDVFDLKANEVELSNYFTLEMPHYDKTGLMKSLPYPIVRKDNSGKSSKFVQRHYLRFEYILYNHVDSLGVKLKELALLQIDSADMAKRFCQFLSSNNKFCRYFNVLTNTQSSKSTNFFFSEQEMMKIASRFFYVDTVFRRDTTVAGHVCLGINGQKEFVKNRDYAVLEAFCFEAIYNNRIVMEKFSQEMQRLSEEAKGNFVDFNSFLQYVKQKTFKAMEEDEGLKTLLLKYYRKNKKNLGFSVE